MMNRHAFVRNGLAASALLALVSCSRPETVEVRQEAESEAEAHVGGIMKFYIGNPVAIDPYNVQESSGHQVVWALFDSLVGYDWQARKLVGKAAETWETNDDSTVHTFYLRPDATFHNGEAVTAESFKRAWERICDPTMKPRSAISYHLDPVMGAAQMAVGSATSLSGVEAVDDLTLKVTLVHPMTDFPYVCAHPALAPVPQAALDDPQRFFVAPIGNGPFKMDGEWVPDQSIRVTRFEDYVDSPAHLDGVHFVFLERPETAFTEFTEGHMDFAPVARGRIGELKLHYGLSEDGYTATPGQQVLTGTKCSVYYLAVNCEDAVMCDVDVRRAISLAIDRQRICDNFFDGTYLPADRIVPISVDGDVNGAWEYSRYDMDEAKSLLDKAYPAADDGKRGLRLSLLFDSGGGHKGILNYVSEDLEKVGIEIELSSFEYEAFLDAAKSRHCQLVRFGWVADYPTMDNFLYPLFFSTSADNHSNYAVDAVDEALLEARGTVDEVDRRLAYREASKRIGEDMPVIPLMFQSHNHVVSERVARLYYDPQGVAHFADAEMV